METHKIDTPRWIGIAVVVLMARPTGDRLSAFISLMPNDDNMDIDTWLFLFKITTFLQTMIGYAIAGVLVGLCAHFILRKEVKKYAKWLPVVLLLAVFLSSFLNLFSAGVAAKFDVFGIIGRLLSTQSGYAYLFLLPICSYLTIWFIEKKTAIDKREISFPAWLREVFTTSREKSEAS